MELAIILCCYNRIEKTKNCILSLQKILSKMADINHRFYVFDDGSTDGTVEMLQSILNLSDVLLQGTNNYWSKSMHKAMARAKQDSPDIYLCVNDDVDFCDNALEIMLEDFNAKNGDAAIVGSTIFDGTITYGGLTKRQVIINPKPELQECYFANFNCFMVGKKIVGKIGLIDKHYGHSFGDYDYAMRINKAGYKVYVAHDIIGICENDHGLPKYRLAKYSKKERLANLKSPKGLNMSSLLRFTYKTGDREELLNIIRYYVNVRRAISSGRDI